MDYYTWLFGDDIKKHEPKKTVNVEDECSVKHSNMNWYTWMFDENNMRSPKQETIAEHRKHCKAEPGNCPFEKELKQLAKETPNAVVQQEEELSVEQTSKQKRKEEANEKQRSHHLNRIINNVNKWGVSKNKVDAIEKFNAFLRQNDLKLKVSEVIEKFAADRTMYYSVKADVTSENQNPQEVVQTFSQAGFRCISREGNYGQYSYYVSMAGDKLLNPDVNMNDYITSEENRLKSKQRKEWELTDKSQKDKSILQRFASRSEIDKIKLNQKLHDFGGGVIPMWKALIRAHEEGWVMGDINKSEVLFDKKTPSNYLLMPIGSVEYARALGISNEGIIPQNLLKATKVKS